MADNVELDPGAGGAIVSTEEVTTLNGGAASAQHVQRMIAAIRTADATAVDLPGDAANGLDVDVTRLPALPAGTNNIGDVDVLTVPAPLSTTGGGTEAAAQRVTIATDSTGVLSVDDNAGSLTVDSTQLPAALAAGGGIKVEGVAGGVVVPVSGTVTANAGSGPFPVSDNAGSLTVDAPVGTPAFVRLSDGAAAISTLPVSLATNTPDVTDRAGRALGVVASITNALPAGTNNIGDVDVLSLPALVAGAAEIGKVQISDGTDVATVLPVRTVPATTEKVLVTSELPTRLPTFQCVTAEVAPAITIGVKELLTFFHPAAVTVDVYIVEIVVSILVTTASTTAGRTNVEVFKATSAGTGGTNLAAADVGGGLGTSAVISNAAANVMQVKTGGGALGTALIRQGVEHATQPLGAQRFEIFKASSVGNGIIMRGGSADGINIQVNRVAAHTALVDQWTASIRWIEL